MATLLIIGACTTAGQALATRWARWAGHANDGLVLVDREAPAALCAALAPRAAIAETMPHDWRAALRTWRPDFVLDCAGIAAEWPTAPDGFRAPPGRWLWLTADRKAALPRPGWATPIYLDQVYDPADVARGALAQILDAFLDGRRVPVYGDGSETSDWLHADDFARGIGFAFQQARAGESFDLRSGEVVSRLELLQRVLSTPGFGTSLGAPRHFRVAPRALERRAPTCSHLCGTGVSSRAKCPSQGSRDRMVSRRASNWPMASLKRWMSRWTKRRWAIRSGSHRPHDPVVCGQTTGPNGWALHAVMLQPFHRGQQVFATTPDGHKLAR
jgi:hypothetical protein